MTSFKILCKVSKSCAASASLSRPRPTKSSGKTRSRQLEMETDAVDDKLSRIYQLCPVKALHGSLFMLAFDSREAHTTVTGLSFNVTG